MGGGIPYGVALAYLAQKKGSGDPEFCAEMMRFYMRQDKYAEPSAQALALMVKNMGQDILDLLSPIAELVEGACACYH